MNDSMTDLFEDDEASMEVLFREAFDHLECCQASLDRCGRGSAVKASTPAAETMARGLVPQGEGGNEVRVSGGQELTRPVTHIFSQ